MLVAMGEIYHETGQHGEAWRCFTEGIELAQQMRESDTYFFVNTYFYLSSVAGYLNRFNDVLLYADSMQVEVNRLKLSHPVVNFQFYDFVAAV